MSVMTVYWAGGEDISFPIGTAVSVDTTTSRFRSAWARCDIGCSSSTVASKSNPFASGARTSAWLSVRIGGLNVGTATKIIGFGLSGTEKFFGIGSDTSTGSKICLFKWDGSTRTQLAAETGTSIAGANTVLRLDMQVISFGVSATVNIYASNILIISFTGDLTVSGMTSNFDSVYMLQGSNVQQNCSEILVADSDTRGVLGVQTGALTGAGTTNSWTNTTFSNINGTSFSDANPTFSNTAAQDNQYNITDPTAASYDVIAVVTHIRAASPGGSTATQIKMGFNSGGSVAFGTGSTKTPTTVYSTLEQIDATNPVTGVGFLQSEMNALQLDFQSA